MDPLAQLKDIHLPEPIHNYPLAIGWWILAITLMLIVAVSIIKWRKRQQLQKNQQIALKNLQENCHSNADIFSLLKWSALQYFPRTSIASLHGEPLQQFFNDNLPAKHQEKFKTLSQVQFTAQYHPSESTALDTDFKHAAKIWLTYALPPKDMQSLSQVNQQGAVL